MSFKTNTGNWSVGIKSLPALLSCCMLFYSCQKDPVRKKTIYSMDDLEIPSGFNWESSREVKFQVSVEDLKFLDDTHVVAIYDGDPASGGKLLSKGSTDLDHPFTVTLSLAKTITSVYITKTAPDGSTVTEKVSVNSQSIAKKISAASAGSLSLLSGVKGSVKIAEEDCSSGCTQTITTSNTNLNLNSSSDVVCITGSNITVGFNANAGTVRICGKNVTVQNASFNNSAKLIISSSGSAVFSNLNFNGSSTSLQNSGSLTVNGSFSIGGKFDNYGTLTTSGDFNLNSGSSLVNNSVINVGGSMNNNTSNLVTNNGSVTTANNLQLNSGSSTVNNCNIWVKGDFNNNSLLKNYALVKVEKTSTVNSGAEIQFVSAAMVRTSNMMLNGKLTGTGSTSLVKVLKTTTINGSGSVNGTLQYCDENGIETNTGKFTDGAIRSCSVYIPVSECNAEGNGKTAIIDTDNDGISDVLDEYPNDPDKAFNNYYPSKADDAGETVAFEDLWPMKGDYDMNDVVVSYKYKIVTNAQNQVVHVDGNYTLYAVGGGYANGFGIQFPSKAANIKSLSGATLESGQSKAVVILFNNMIQELSGWNTRVTDVYATPKTYSVSFDDEGKIPLSEYGLGSYNPFIWNGSTGFGRGYEIHLPGMKPTDLADLSLFGKTDDASNVAAGKYYVTANGLPWAIKIPVSKFDYPYESVNIFKAFLKFTDWAQSGGTQYPDWYVNTADGYRDSQYIYKKP